MQALGQDEVRVTGTVRSVSVEGGCWQLVAEDGTMYELLSGQAPKDVLGDGRKVTVVVRPRPDMMSTCQVGQIVEVVRVERQH